MTNMINTDDVRRIVEKYIDTTMELNDLPGLAIGVAAGGSSSSPQFIKSVRGYRQYPYAHKQLSNAQKQWLETELLREDDIFHCASVSKLFTSSAIMKLVEAGVLNLYDRVCNLLPDLEFEDPRFEEIRLWNMLSHTSGLGDVSDYHWYDCETDEDSLRRYVFSDEVTKQPMLWDPQISPEFYGLEYDESGAPVHLFRYSNVAYEILGHIVSEYSSRLGKKLSYEDFVAQYLLKPAGMTNSTMKTFERDLEEIVQPYEKQKDRSIGPVTYYPYTRQHAPSSTLTSNLEDLLKWGCTHLRGAKGKPLLESESPAESEFLAESESLATGDSLLRREGLSERGLSPAVLQHETYDSIWRDYATVPNNGEKMGLGWFMRIQKVGNTGHGVKTGENTSGQHDGLPREYTLYGHEGMDDGFRASFWICPELDLVTVVLSNLSTAPVKRINKSLFELVATQLV